MGDRLKGLTGGWSKYGGGRMSVVKSKIDKTWYCQSCRRENPKEVSPFLYELDDGDYIRICAICMNEGVLVLQQRRVVIEMREFDKNKPM